MRVFSATLQNLNNLLENYLEPLKRETVLSNAEINALFGNIQEIVTFQRQFLQNLEHSIELEADFSNFDHPSQFKARNSQFSYDNNCFLFSLKFLKHKNDILIIQINIT